MSVCVTERERNQFPSVLLHPPPLAGEFSASYGEMSRRSGVAAEEDKSPSGILPDTFPSWNDGVAKSAIVGFVSRAIT